MPRLARSSSSSSRLTHRVAPSPLPPTPTCSATITPSSSIGTLGNSASASRVNPSALVDSDDATALRAKNTQLRQTLERQTLQIETLQGRGTALRLASEEAATRGRAWAPTEAQRFAYLPRAPPDVFLHDTLTALLEQALPATNRRVAHAIREAKHAREEAERAEAMAASILDGIFHKFATATGADNTVSVAAADFAIRQAASGISMRAKTHSSRLRAALTQLEAEASAMASAHTTDMRHLSARLTRQRDAIQTALLLELGHAETEGARSIHGLEASLSTRDSELSAARYQLTEVAVLIRELHVVESDASRDALSIDRLQQELAATRDELETTRAELATTRTALAEKHARLEREIKQRHEEGLRLRTDRLPMLTAMAEVEDALDRARRQLASESACLVEELADEESARAHDASAGGTARAAAEAELKHTINDLKSKLKAANAEARSSNARLSEELKVATAERDAAEASLESLVRGAEAEKNEQRAFYVGKITQLHDRVRDLRTSTSRGRAMHYWASMKGSAVAGAREQEGRASPPRVTTHTKANTKVHADNSIVSLKVDVGAQRGTTELAELSMDEWMRWKPPTREPR